MFDEKNRIRRAKKKKKILWHTFFRMIIFI